MQGEEELTRDRDNGILRGEGQKDEENANGNSIAVNASEEEILHRDHKLEWKEVRR